MTINRRDFSVLAGGVAAFMLAPTVTAAEPVADGTPAFSPNAWHQRIKRIMQVNFTEQDAANFDVDAWIDYVVSVRSECTFISISSGVAFYPTALPDFPRSRWLNDRDIFGECVAAAKKHNVRVVGRGSIDSARVELAAKHPDWFRRRADGLIVVPTNAMTLPDGRGPSVATDYGRTCQFSSYYSDFVPKMIEEVMRRYAIDGVYTNGWPAQNVPLCYCAACRQIGDPKSQVYRAAYQDRVKDLWAIYNNAVLAGNKNAVYSGSLGGGIRGGELDLQSLMSRAMWMFADNQGRSEDFTPSWDPSQQTRVARAMSGSRPAVCSTALWAYAGSGAWRTVTGNSGEVRTRLYQTLAAGGTLHVHWLGFQAGFREDRRWQELGREVMTWQADNATHFHNVRSIANVALVVSPRSNRVYKAPPGTDVTEPFQGVYKLLNEARIAFDIILETDLSRDSLNRYAVLILPNIAAISDLQAAAIQEFAAHGGSILATFETGLYNEFGDTRADFALADLFSMHSTGPRIGFGFASAGGGQPGANSMQRIERSHPIVAGFRNTTRIEGSAWRVPIAADEPPILTDIPQFPVYPVEAVFPATSHTNDSTMVARERGDARLVYLAGDIDAGYWRSSAADLGDLLVGSVRWLMRERQSLKVEGDGLIEVCGWRTEVGYTVHLVNHTNPNFRGGAFRNTYPLGPQKITLQLQSTAPIRAAKLLRANSPVAFHQDGRSIEVVVPTLTDYEVLALTE